MATQDVFFWRLAGRSAPTGLAIVHWIGCINAIKMGHGITNILTKLTFKIFSLASNNNGPKADISGLSFTETCVKAISICVQHYKG